MRVIALAFLLPAGAAVATNVMLDDTCSYGDSVACPGEQGQFCAGDQCCPSGQTCPSAHESFDLCPSGKTVDCIGPSPTPSPSPLPTRRRTAPSPPTPVPAGISIRVAKALGSRGYDQVRVSLVRYDGVERNATATASVEDVAWSYSSQFVHRWTDMHLSSAVVAVTPGVDTTLNLDGHQINVRLPKQGEGSVGLLLADPCIVQSQWCQYADTWDVARTYQNVLNSLAEHNELDYWMNIGDLFYDQVGDVTKAFFSGLSLEAQAKIHGIAMGNHDYWNNGSPDSANDGDNFGNGIMQWYAQDAMSAKVDASTPFDFSADPASHQVAKASNFFWYNMVGNVAFVSYSGEASWVESQAYFEEACNWAQAQNPALLVLLGHWDAVNDGCRSGMDARDAYSKVKALPGCSALSPRIKYFEGHSHCNEVIESNTGFMIGANGMKGCGDFGIFILDTRNGEARLTHFNLGSGGQRNSKWSEILGCITSKGYSDCIQYANLWMQQDLETAELVQNQSSVTLV